MGIFILNYFINIILEMSNLQTSIMIITPGFTNGTFPEGLSSAVIDVMGAGGGVLVEYQKVSFILQLDQY